MSGTSREEDRPPDAFIAAYFRLRVAIESACQVERCAPEGPSWPMQVAAAVGAALEWVAADPAAAHVLTSGAFARGKAGFADHDRMLDHFAALLESGRCERPEGERLPEITEKAMVGGLAMLIVHRLDSGQVADLPELVPEAVQFVLTPFVGSTEAKRIATLD